MEEPKNYLLETARWLYGKFYIVCGIAALLLLVLLPTPPASFLPVAIARKAPGFLGALGFLISVVVLAYYIVRLLMMRFNKSTDAMKKMLLTHMRALFPTLRLLHPVLGITALTLLSVHGAWYFARISPKHLAQLFTTINSFNTGLIAISCYTLLALSGVIIRRFPAKLTFRRAHKYAAFLWLFAVLVHLL